MNLIFKFIFNKDDPKLNIQHAWTFGSFLILIKKFKLRVSFYQWAKIIFWVKERDFGNFIK